jgi:predicted ester cyclase
MSLANKALVHRFVEEVINRGNTRLLADLVDPAHVLHAPDGDLYGLDGVRADLAEWRVGFPDVALTVEDVIAEGDKVVSRFVLRGTHAGPALGVPPTGQRVAVGGVAIERVRDGRLVESWVSLDTLRLLRQLGALR